MNALFARALACIADVVRDCDNTFFDVSSMSSEWRAIHADAVAILDDANRAGFLKPPTSISDPAPIAFVDALVVDAWQYRAVIEGRDPSGVIAPGCSVRHECANAAAGVSWCAMTAADVVDACRSLDPPKAKTLGATVHRDDVLGEWLSDTVRPQLAALTDDKAREWLALLAVGHDLREQPAEVVAKMALAVVLDLAGFGAVSKFSSGIFACCCDATDSFCPVHNGKGCESDD